MTKRIYRPSISQTELETILRAIYFRKRTLENSAKTDYKTQGEMKILVGVFAHFCDLLHGKVQGRRKAIGSFTACTDDGMVYFKLVDEKWISQVKLELGEQT